MEMFITTVTKAGQITIPKPMRDLLGIGTTDRVQLKVVEGEDYKQLSVEPVEDIMDILGTIEARANKGSDPVEARRKLETSYRRF
ncbi:AbrB/MazE/SpoVT family DNA-binding domain-containing protein [candidate division WWE3 bacterium]|nr:AbrB/MazE/SpoVT family DNA-binding domain-containing protein [candidate division WWE3 bacterium]